MGYTRETGRVRAGDTPSTSPMDSPSPAGSVTLWLGQLKAGDPAAARRLWESYFSRLVAVARRQLRSVPRAAKDEEDVALSAFDSFCRAAGEGQMSAGGCSPKNFS